MSDEHLHATPERFCNALDAWADIMSKRDKEFARSWRTVRAYIYKSCLLDRMLYGGEALSETPCPVHKGRWSGIQIGWPGQKWMPSGESVPVDPQLQAWVDAGCRCWQHSCGCATGWQP